MTIFFDKGKVERVIDGDTIVVNGNHIRMIGIDTPEIHKNKNSEKKFAFYDGRVISDVNYLWYWAKVAHRELAKMVFKKTVKLYFDPLLDHKGHYGRYLCYVYKGSKDINKMMLTKGLARVYPDNFTKLPQYGMSCYLAQKKRKGIWSGEMK